MTNKPHHWIATGSAAFTEDQAARWASAADHQPIDEPMTIDFDMVICAVCLEHRDEVVGECPGAPSSHEDDHLWLGRFVAMLTAEQADRLLEPETTVNPGRPQSVGVMCILCGASADDPPPGCPERQLWSA